MAMMIDAGSAAGVAKGQARSVLGDDDIAEHLSGRRRRGAWSAS
jgi:hypothetical protein